MLAVVFLLSYRRLSRLWWSFIELVNGNLRTVVRNMRWLSLNELMSLELHLQVRCRSYIEDDRQLVFVDDATKAGELCVVYARGRPDDVSWNRLIGDNNCQSCECDGMAKKN
jgi:hypothetical protein